MTIKLINNCIQINNKYLLPFYIYQKLIDQCIKDNKSKYITLLLQQYENIIYSFNKPKLLYFIITLFNVKLELYSNPFINYLPFCSNCDIDKYFGGVENIQNINTKKYESLLLIDPRPPISYLDNINHDETDFIINNNIKLSIDIIIKNNNDLLSLIIITYYKIEIASQLLIINHFNLLLDYNNYLHIYFIQTNKGYNKYKPTITKFNLLKSFITLKKKHFNKYKYKTKFFIIGTKNKVN